MREISVFVGTVGRVLIVPRNGVINCSQELLSGSVSVYCEGGKGLQFHSNRGHCSYRASKIARDLPNTTRSDGGFGVSRVLVFAAKKRLSYRL